MCTYTSKGLIPRFVYAVQPASCLSLSTWLWLLHSWPPLSTQAVSRGRQPAGQHDSGRNAVQELCSLCCHPLSLTDT